MASCYAARPADSEMPLPWTPESDYSHVISRHLNMDKRVPTKYRCHDNDFQDRDPAELHEQRGYWGRWLFLQSVYAAIPCLLKYPFLLSIRLRNFRHTISQSVEPEYALCRLDGLLSQFARKQLLLVLRPYTRPLRRHYHDDPSSA